VKHGLRNRPHKRRSVQDVAAALRRDVDAVGRAANVAYAGSLYDLAGTLRAIRVRLSAYAELLEGPGLED